MDGKRLHRLEADPFTAPVVERIFAMYAAGHGLRTIADSLAREGIPSPAAYDPERNRHRDTIGWGKQHLQDVLIGLGDVAAGHQARMRWNDEDTWIRFDHQTHPALVDTQILAKAQARLRDGKSNNQVLRPTAPAGSSRCAD